MLAGESGLQTRLLFLSSSKKFTVLEAGVDMFGAGVF